MTKPLIAAACATLLVACSVAAAASAPRQLPTLATISARSGDRPMPRNDGPRPLAASVYAAKLFPRPVLVTVPAGWRGGQGQSREFKAPGSDFRWIVLSQGAAARAQGAITIETSAKPTPSVAAVVAGLRSRGHGPTYGPLSSVTVAGLPARQFDGTAGPNGHIFVPFSPPTHVAAFFADALYVDPGEAFRIDVLAVRGKTVVVFVDSAALPPERFTAFLARAEQILGSLRFPQ
jgi:hypothetical protein